ncbi:hypothetical protein ACIA8K_27920 [Catenuloplanes sp. NPDC051500]|uniref:hypothetical protein n=1 Tax=Catenuloplanes sp. NPDC051500 TaxID=3363959 RepID=UPI0037B6FC5E
MTGQLHVDWESMRTAATALGQISDAFGDRVDAFIATMEGFGQPWGTDDIGMLIGTAHEAVLDAAVDCFDSGIETFQAYAANLNAMADGYEATESGSTESFTAIGSTMPQTGW